MQQPPPYAPAGAAPPPAAMVSKVELTIACTGLRDADVFSKSDPICVVYSSDSGRLKEIGRTERIDDTLNPKFQRQIVLDYHFEEVQKLTFRVFDIDDNSNDVNKADFLGKCECTLGQIVSSSNFKKPLDYNGRDFGTISVQAQEQGGMQQTLQMTLKGAKLDKKDWFGKSDPFLEFHRQLLDGTYTLAHRTEFIKNTLNPHWKRMKINTRRLCDNNPDTLIKVECYDWNSSGTHDIIGAFITTLAELEQARAGKTWSLVHPKKKGKRGYRHSGEVIIENIEVKREYTFLEYIQGGCELNFVVGIDFTGSNGDPRDAASLHYIGGSRPNQYVEALTAVGNVVQDYDHDQLYPAFGFGARLPPTWQVSHQFSLNGNPENPDCQGIAGILGAYQQCIHTVQLYGPTNASPIVGNVAKMAREALHQQQASTYYILLLITDGILTDMDQTIHMIIEASELPMSIIIIGVGDADFEDMERLDGDDKLLSLGSRVAKRDIVQFVPFREFKNAPLPQRRSDTLDLELATRILRREDEERLEELVENLASWLTQLLGIPVTPDTFLSTLQDGVVLCKVANKVQVAAVKYKAANTGSDVVVPLKGVTKFHKRCRPSSFHARENITKFVKWAEEFGVGETLLFDSDELITGNAKKVALCLQAIARKTKILIPTLDFEISRMVAVLRDLSSLLGTNLIKGKSDKRTKIRNAMISERGFWRGIQQRISDVVKSENSVKRDLNQHDMQMLRLLCVSQTGRTKLERTIETSRRDEMLRVLQAASRTKQYAYQTLLSDLESESEESAESESEYTDSFTAHEIVELNLRNRYSFVRVKVPKTPNSEVGMELLSPEMFFFGINKPSYDELSLDMFMQGYTALLADSRLQEDEQHGRLRLLQLLFTYITRYPWWWVRSCHRQITVLVSTGELAWSGDLEGAFEKVLLDCSDEESPRYLGYNNSSVRERRTTPLAVRRVMNHNISSYEVDVANVFPW